MYLTWRITGKATLSAGYGLNQNRVRHRKGGDSLSTITYPALVVLYSTFRIGLHGSGFFPSLGCFPVADKKEEYGHMDAQYTPSICFCCTSTRLYTYINNTTVCTQQRLTMWCGDLCRLGWGSYIPRGQSAIRVAANKLFTLMVPGD